MPNRLKKILIFTDAHHPYVDKKAWELVLKVGHAFNPDVSIIGGDFGDFYGVSDHSKDPRRALKMDMEIREIIKAVKQVKAIGAKENYFIAGNHEDRLRRYLQARAPELFDFVSIPEILKLKRLGFKYIPYQQTLKLGKLHITHDLGNAGRYAHYKAIDTIQHNIVINHTHRIGYAVEGSSTGERHVTAMFGWLGDLDQIDYMHRAKAQKDWSLGFGVGFLEESTGNVYLCPVPIIVHKGVYSCLVDGKLYKV